MQRGLKRAIDVVCSSAGLLCSAPLLGGTALIVRATMGSPVLFRQDRPGHNGLPFTLVKFRTMSVATEGEGVESDGARLTKVGAMLRKLSIDELPSLWNVLVGDMSLVGPRPLLMQYLDRYTSEQARRHEVRPGVTGWAQVNGRNAISWERKFELDVWYVDNWTLLLDLEILLATVLKVTRGADINSADSATTSEFLGTDRRQAS